jgi:hypothetical protein
MENIATTATPTQEELLQLKDTQDKMASAQAKKPVQSTWREFSRNLGRKTQQINTKIRMLGNKVKDKLEAANTWYIAEYMNTVFGGAFLGSLITCASIIFKYVIGTVAIATSLQVAGAAIFMVPVLVLCIYFAIRFLIESVTAVVNLAKKGAELGKAMVEFKKNNPAADIMSTATSALKDQLTDPTNTSAY